MLFKSANVYLDDILLISRDFPEHYKHLEMLFQKFRDANLRMNGKKCSFAREEVKYIGHILSADGIRIDPSKTDVISSWPRPKTHEQIRSYLGMTNYYKKFIDRYSQRSAPLRNLLSKDVPFVWSDRIIYKLMHPWMVLVTFWARQMTKAVSTSFPMVDADCVLVKRNGL